MSERESRAVGAGTKIRVGEQEYTLRPIAVQQLCDLEREALQYFRRQVLETYRENADLLGDRADDLIARKFEEVSRLTLDELPKKSAYDASRLPVTEEARRWVEDFRREAGGDRDEVLDDGRVRALIAAALDQERITPEQVEKLTGQRPALARVRYDQWWVTGCFEGMVAFIHSSLRQDHPEVTKQDVRGWPISAIFETSREVEKITVPDLGNG